MADAPYPFLPASMARLQAGHFWGIELLDGRFACGLCLGVLPGGKSFVAVLLDRVGESLPTTAEISRVNDWVWLGQAGLQAIQRCGGAIQGRRDLASFPFEVPERVLRTSSGMFVVRGVDIVRDASRDDRRGMEHLRSINANGMRVHANRLWAGYEPERPVAGAFSAPGRGDRRCRVCGLEASQPPWGHDDRSPSGATCWCCGVEFGTDDATVEGALAHRRRWVDAGARWHMAVAKPVAWSLETQLEQVPDIYR